MNRICVALLLVLLPSLAMAQQPYDPDSGQPATPPSPYPPPPPSQPQPPPSQPQPPPPPGYGPYQPQPGYPQPGYQAPPSTVRRGLTFEANLGIGYARGKVEGGDASNSDAALAGLNIGLGGWLNPKLNISARIAGVQIKDDGFDPGDSTLVNAFFGPCVQYWIDDHAFVGGGVGFATFRFVGGNAPSDAGTNGFGFDLRGGYSFGTPGSNHSFNVSVEINPSFYDENGTSLQVTSFALLAGYQYL